MIIGFAFLIMLVGLLLYAFAVNPKVQEIGRIMFAFGLLGLILQSPEAIKTFKF